MDISNLVGFYPRIEKASRNYKKSFRKPPSREKKVEDFITSEDFQLFCIAEELEENSLLQFCVGFYDEIHILYAGRVIGREGISYRRNSEVLLGIKAPRFINHLDRGMQHIFFVATYWLSKDEKGKWQAELLLADEAFLEKQPCTEAFKRAAFLMGGTVKEAYIAEASLQIGNRTVISCFRLAEVLFPDESRKFLAISFDNGALVSLMPEQLETGKRYSGYHNLMLRTKYNWFTPLTPDDFMRVK